MNAGISAIRPRATSSAPTARPSAKTRSFAEATVHASGITTTDTPAAAICCRALFGPVDASTITSVGEVASTFSADT